MLITVSGTIVQEQKAKQQQKATIVAEASTAVGASTVVEQQQQRWSQQQKVEQPQQRQHNMVWGRDVDLEAPLHISELNSAILFLSLKNRIALFSSEMCRGASKSTSHPQTMN